MTKQLKTIEKVQASLRVFQPGHNVARSLSLVVLSHLFYCYTIVILTSDYVACYGTSVKNDMFSSLIEVTSLSFCAQKTDKFHLKDQRSFLK